MRVSQPFDDPHTYRVTLNPAEAGVVINSLASALKGDGRPGPNIAWSGYGLATHNQHRVQFVIEEE